MRKSAPVVNVPASRPHRASEAWNEKKAAFTHPQCPTPALSLRGLFRPSDLFWIRGGCLSRRPLRSLPRPNTLLTYTQMACIAPVAPVARVSRVRSSASSSSMQVWNPINNKCAPSIKPRDTLPRKPRARRGLDAPTAASREQFPRRLARAGLSRTRVAPRLAPPRPGLAAPRLLAPRGRP
jgi:hypothetical protein